MIGSTAYGDDEQCLEKDTYRESVHGEASRIDLHPQNVYHTLPEVFGRASARTQTRGWI